MEKLSAPPAFGYQNDRGKIGNNLLKVVGYIPLVGSMAGIGRIAAIAFSPKYEVSSPKLYLAGRIGRGVIETLSLGIVFLPFDVGITIYRQHVKKVSPVEQPVCQILLDIPGLGKFLASDIRTGPGFRDNIQKAIEEVYPDLVGRNILGIYVGEQILNAEGKYLGDAGLSESPDRRLPFRVVLDKGNH